MFLSHPNHCQRRFTRVRSNPTPFLKACYCHTTYQQIFPLYSFIHIYVRVYLFICYNFFPRKFCNSLTSKLQRIHEIIQDRKVFKVLIHLKYRYSASIRNKIILHLILSLKSCLLFLNGGPKYRTFYIRTFVYPILNK